MFDDAENNKILAFPDTSMSITKDAKNADMALKFLEYMTSAEAGEIWSQCSISSISPSQNPGMDAKTSATTTHTWSVMEYWRTAERIPSEIPIMEETHMESSARINVFGNLARISLITG